MSHVMGSSLADHNGAALRPANEVLGRLQMRSQGYTSREYDKVSQLGIVWREQDHQHRTSGYYANVDGRELRLTDQAIRGVSKMVRVTNNVNRYWAQFSDRNAFPKQLAHILENGLKGTRRLLVRHDGISIRAIQPHSYKIRDAYDLLNDFLTMIQERIGVIQGISTVEWGEPGDICSYRIVLGTNILPELRQDYGQYMMFMLACSETGAVVHGGGATAITALGLYRTICTNSAIRERLVTKWNHKANSLNNFYNHSSDRIGVIGDYGRQYAKIFTELNRTTLNDLEPSDLLFAFNSEKLISNPHFEAASAYINAPMEDGRAVTTQYDVFNVLTRAAQDLPSLQQRQQAESRALHLFTEPGGVFDRIRNAANERAREMAMRGRGTDGFAESEDEDD